jgi:peptidyl-prolyl cis-trans isomerase SurA
MKRTGLFVFTMCLFFGVSVAQQTKPLLVVNGQEISAEEFMAVFMKNSTTKSVSKEEINEYLELYINFRLKVAEAMALQLDTLESFRTELAGYRKTLAQPYLTKTEILDKLVKEVWDRMQWDLRASHILIKVSPYASPADTLKAYKKAMGVRNRVIKGESFKKVAYEVSEDESARGTSGDQPMQGNYGDLGYFSALDLVYDFENVAYAMKVGEISMPVRSEFGYHIIQLTDRKPSLGRVQTAHILVSVAPDATETEKAEALSKAEDIYNRIMLGGSYEDLAKELSDDKGSGMRGGVLPWFGVFRMIPEFIAPLYDMKNGDVAKPILTSYGYHIVKLIDRKPVGGFDEIKNDLKTRIMRDVRYKSATSAFVETLKQENGFVEYPEALKKFISAVSDSIYQGTWRADMVYSLNDPLFKIGDRTHTQRDFAAFLQSNVRIEKDDNKDTYIRSIYKRFIEEMVIAYENDNLEKKYPQFAALMKEYHDGILLFDLTDKMVWSKALRDTAGLNAFYETIKMNYMWPERVEGTIYFCNDEAKAKLFYKEMSKAIKKGTDIAFVMEMFNSPEETNIPEESGIYIKADHPYFASVNSAGLSKPFFKDDKYVIVKTDRIIDPEPKALREVKGVVTNEYQNYLEKEWIKELREKYNWYVNQEVLEALYTK